MAAPTVYGFISACLALMFWVHPSLSFSLAAFLALSAIMSKHLLAPSLLFFTESYSDIGPALSTFGIPTSIIPITDNGDGTSSLNTKHHEEWINGLIQKSKVFTSAPVDAKEGGSATTGSAGILGQTDPTTSSSSSSVVDEGAIKEQVLFISETGPFDILMGARAKAIDESVGNLQLKRLVEMNLDSYNSAPRLVKTKMAEMMVMRIKESGGRFLKHSQIPGEGWIEVTDDVARAKIAHTFRNQRRPQSSSSTSSS